MRHPMTRFEDMLEHGKAAIIVAILLWVVAIVSFFAAMAVLPKPPTDLTPISFILILISGASFIAAFQLTLYLGDICKKRSPAHEKTLRLLQTVATSHTMIVSPRDNGLW